MNNINDIIDQNTGFKPCPFCGEIPSVTNRGTCFDIECCVSMSFQKYDVIGNEGMKEVTMDETNYMFSYEIEKEVFEYCKKTWNTRI